jgi:hypothetical protein
MALFSECRLKCAQNILDIADIVREGFIANYEMLSMQKLYLYLVMLR